MRNSALATAALFMTTTACVVTPESDDGTIFESDKAVHFQGFASRPGVAVELYGFNHDSGDWDLFATTTSGTGPLEYGGRTIYVWNIHHRLDTEYFHLNYFDNFIGGWATYQVREPGSAFPVLLTFDPGGLNCTTQRVSSGEDLFTAAWECRAQNFDELRLYYPFG